MRYRRPTRFAALAAACLAAAAALAGAAHADDGFGGGPQRWGDRPPPQGRPLDRVADARALLAEAGASRDALARRDGLPRDQALQLCRSRGFFGQALQRCADAAQAASAGSEGGADSRGGNGGNGGGGNPAPATTGASASQPPPATTTQQAPAVTTRPAVTTLPRAPQPEQPRGPVIADRGIVQAIGPDVVVLRALDGSSIIIPLSASTLVYSGDRPASIGDVRPGAVATVRHQDRGLALDIRIAPPPQVKLRTDRGVTERTSVTLLQVRLRDGTLLTTAMNPTITAVVAPNGQRLSPGDLRPGLLVNITYDPTGTVAAATVKIIRRVS